MQATADLPCVAALNRITDATGASIVVSSSWRIGTPVIELRELLSRWGVTGKVIDRTPIIETKRGHIFVGVTRGKEICKWLEKYQQIRGEVESFVILDDDSDMDELCDRHVKTTFEAGLTEADANKAIAILNGSARLSITGASFSTK